MKVIWTLDTGFQIILGKKYSIHYITFKCAIKHERQPTTTQQLLFINQFLCSD